MIRGPCCTASDGVRLGTYSPEESESGIRSDDGLLRLCRPSEHGEAVYRRDRRNAVRQNATRPVPRDARPRQNDPAIALREIGRGERTFPVIERAFDMDPRCRAGIGLNGSEARQVPTGGALRVGHGGEIRAAPPNGVIGLRGPTLWPGSPSTGTKGNAPGPSRHAGETVPSACPTSSFRGGSTSRLQANADGGSEPPIRLKGDLVPGRARRHVAIVGDWVHGSATFG